MSTMNNINIILILYQSIDFLYKAVMASRHLDCVHVTMQNLINESDSKDASKVQAYAFFSFIKMQ